MKPQEQNQMAARQDSRVSRILQRLGLNLLIGTPAWPAAPVQELGSGLIPGLPAAFAEPPALDEVPETVPDLRRGSSTVPPRETVRAA